MQQDPDTIWTAEARTRACAPQHRRGPLNGIRVLDISTVYAAPITAMLLGDYGADVVKIEHPAGDPARSHGANKNGHGLWWKVISRNKRCVTLNLGTPDGQQILRDLIVDADVLVENFRPGVLEKWGLGPDRLHGLNPGLIMLRVTGFGQTGPYATRRAFGTLAEAMRRICPSDRRGKRSPNLAGVRSRRRGSRNYRRLCRSERAVPPCITG
jgi:crotonobetainyl-CoA:carnitine CoA-transferase CaiB-like acyl-CoA transferase